MRSNGVRYDRVKELGSDTIAYSIASAGWSQGGGRLQKIEQLSRQPKELSCLTPLIAS